LPPPLSIGPTPGVSTKSGPGPRQTGEAPKGAPPPPAPRSALDLLFGVQR
jgi:hypothetical protein